jgi:phthiocerol/phenolphthiocerol synthesis type-I polyketide synthase E
MNESVTNPHDLSNSDAHIAVVGMSLRLPGATTPEQYWANLAEGVESISHFSLSDLLAAGIPHQMLDNPSFVRSRGMLPGIDEFDGGLFGFTPLESLILDPQQRIFLQLAWEALDYAGCDPTRWDGSIGVFGGTGTAVYMYEVFSNKQLRDQCSPFQIGIHNDKDFIATRTSYKLNLTGPSLTIQTACSTSLVAVHLACASLLSGECDLALAGAVSAKCRGAGGYLRDDLHAASEDGHCRPFSKNATGVVPSDGGAIVALKRMADAIRDRDHIHAVILGSAINNDGATKVGFTAPSVDGEARVIREAIAMADLTPKDISMIEAHGTATNLGDRIEIAALKQVFSSSEVPRKRSCALGSAKSNIGHVDTAAGVAGLIKVILALQHRQIPPSLFCENPDPEHELDKSPFYVPTALTVWESERNPRRGGVSSFGIGGTNAHIVVEEPPRIERRPSLTAFQVLPLCAGTRTALERMSKNLSLFLSGHPDSDLQDVAFTMQCGRRSMQWRRFVVANSSASAAQLLATPVEGYLAETARASSHAVIWMFPGHGSQYRGMGSFLRSKFPRFREALDECASAFQQHLGIDIRTYLNEDASQLLDMPVNRVSISHPCLFAAEYALAQTLLALNVKPTVLIGYSLGEYVAACVSGALSLSDATRIIALRARLIETLPSAAMLHVAAPESALLPVLIPGVSLTAVNSQYSCTVGGTEKSVSAFEGVLAHAGIVFWRVRAGVAGHSEWLDPILDAFASQIRGLRMKVPRVPFVSNLTGELATTADLDDSEYWVKQFRNPIKFHQGFKAALAGSHGAGSLVECGPGNYLTSLALAQVEDRKQWKPVHLLRHHREKRDDEELFLDAVGLLWSGGEAIDWNQLPRSENVRKTLLPSYPFEPHAYWVETPSERGSGRNTEFDRHGDLSECFYLPSWRPTLSLAPWSSPKRPMNWLIFAEDGEFADVLVSVLTSAGQVAITVSPGTGWAKLGEQAYSVRPENEEDYLALVRDLSSHQMLPDRIVHAWTVTRDPAPSDQCRFDSIHVLGLQSILFLSKALDALSIYRSIRLGVVSNAMFDVMGHGGLEPEKAPLAAGAMVIGQEYPNIRPVCISVDGDHNPSTVVNLLLSEMIADQQDSHVAYWGSRRFVEEYVVAPIRVGQTGVRDLRKNGTYVIFGGFGNVGLQIAQHFIDTASASVVLAGKSVLPERSDWHKYKAGDDLTGRRIRAIEAMEEAGGRVLTARADVADPDQIEAVLHLAEERFGKIAGIVYAAAVTTSDSIFKPIATLESADCEEQFRPKVNGMYALKASLQNRDVDFCLLLSSNASILGGIGMCSYAAANAFLNAFAASRSQVHGPWISSCWDGWPNTLRTGLRAISSSMEEMKLSSAEAKEALSRILHSAASGVISVSLGDLEARRRFWVNRGSEDAGETADVNSFQSSNGTSTTPTVKGDALEDTISDIWRKQLGIPDIGPDDDFFALGGNSLTATQIISHLRASTGMQIPLRLFFGNPTIRQLTKAVAGIRSTPSSVRAYAEPAQDNLAELSDSEVAAAIAQLSSPQDN